MLVLNQMKAADVVTVNKGEVQAVVGPNIFKGFMPNFASCPKFAVDAKAFVDNVKILEDDFMVQVRENSVKLFDSAKEVTIAKTIPETMLRIPQGPWHSGDITQVWGKINDFATADYPGIRCTSSYFEALSAECIVRIEYDTFQDELMLSSCKIPKKANAYAFISNRLWVRYPDSSYAVIGKLNVRFPSTDSFFEEWPDCHRIPNHVATSLVSAEMVQFKEGYLEFKTKDISKTVIENIDGQGEYDCTFFRKIVLKATHWKTTPKLLYFENAGLTGVLENKANA